MATPIWRGSQALIEAANSPRHVFGESIRVERNFSGPYAICLASAPGYSSQGTGLAAGLSVLESEVTHERGGIGRLKIIYGKLPGDPAIDGIPLPPSTEELERNQLEYAIEKHSNYASLGAQDLVDINTVINTSWEDEKNQAAYNRVALDPIALELLIKRQKGVTHFVNFPPVYVRRSYHWDEPAVSGGGFIEPPITINVTLPTGFSWLRMADSLSHNGTHWERVSKWTGSEDIDTDLYG